MPTFLRLLFLLSLNITGFAASNSDPASNPTAAKPQQFIYVLRLIPRLHDDSAWTESDNAVLQRHVAHLKSATESGQIILAGRTMEPADKTFGLVIFTAPDEAAARAFMQSDPCVAENVMTAELHPYAVVFRAK